MTMLLLFLTLYSRERIVREIDPDVAREERLHAPDLAKDLLRHGAVGGVPLFGRAQADEVVKRAKIPGEESALSIGERQDVLGFLRELRGYHPVSIARPLHQLREDVPVAILDYFRRRLVAVRVGEELGRLRGHAVPLDVTERAVIYEDV